MKSQSYRDSEADRTTGTNPGENRSIRERGMHAVNARPPPAVLYRRYPSLSDDGQPYFPRLGRKPFFSLGVFVLLAILAAIIVALVAIE